MSEPLSLTEIVVSQLFAPRDPVGEAIGMAIALLLLLAYCAFEYGVARELVRLVRALRARAGNRTPPPGDPR